VTCGGAQRAESTNSAMLASSVDPGREFEFTTRDAALDPEPARASAGS
jgi:hypothetical protein